MREIKFRAWDKSSNIMRTDITSIRYNLDGSINQVDVFEGVDILFPEKEAILMQYTGLKDKNGVEIYEGDVFHLDDDMAPAVVEYTNEMDEQGSPASEYCLALYEHGKRFQRLSMGEFYINKCEVIGNIYENPELIESKK